MCKVLFNEHLRQFIVSLCFSHLGSYGRILEGCRKQYERYDRGQNHQREVQSVRNERREYLTLPMLMKALH